MSRRTGLILVQVSLLLFLLSWSVRFHPLNAQSSTPTPTSAPTSTPPRPNIPVGINFWDPEINPTISAQGLFPSGSRGYVLLMKDDVYKKINPHDPDSVTHLKAVINVGLIPIIRYDYQLGGDNPQTVPKDEQGVSKWKEEFKNFIIEIRDKYPSQVNLFIVGNEPGHPAEGGITPKDYAKAYAALWRHVHETEPTISISNARLLVAGQAAHQNTPYPNTMTWLSDVSKEVIDVLQANVDGYAIHAYGFGREYDAQWLLRPSGVDNVAATLWGVAPVGEGTPTPSPDNPLPSCNQPWKANQPCDGLGDANNWPGDDGFQIYRDQLNDLVAKGITLTDKPVYITELNTNAWGVGPETALYNQQLSTSPYVPANNYPVGWILEAAQDVDTYNATHQNIIKGITWFVGAPNQPDRNSEQKETENWRYFALTQGYGRLPCAREDFQYASGVPGTSPCNDIDNVEAILHVAPRFFQCEMVGITITGYDEESGLNLLTVVASPAQILDLSWTKISEIFAGILDIVPEVGSYATLTLSDRAGNVTTQRVYNPGRNQAAVLLAPAMITQTIISLSPVPCCLVGSFPFCRQDLAPVLG